MLSLPGKKFEMVTTLPCPHCRKVTQVAVDSASYDLWKKGSFIQSAFTKSTMNERELLMTGFHSHCWDEVFGSDWEEQEEF